MIDLTISIVNTNNRDMLDACLASIRSNTRRISYETIVVDNACTDGSADMVAEKYPWAQLICNSGRLGFSANHNQALRLMRGRYCIILNEDTALHPECLDLMVEYMDAHQDIGALGPLIHNSDGSLQQSVFRIPTISVLVSHALFLGAVMPNIPYFGGYRKWPHNAIADVPFLSGACIMFPSELMRAVGYMDDGFFIYCEDPDICKRVREAGRRVVFFPHAQITHFGGGTFTHGGGTNVNHFLISTHRFFRKHYGRTAELAAAALLFSGAAAHLAPASKREYFAARRDLFRRVVIWYRNNGIPRSKV